MTTGPRPKLFAFIDEAGQRSNTPASSDHFTMAAVAWKEGHDGDARAALATLRADLGRMPTHVLHFVKLAHHDRLYATTALAAMAPRIIVVTVTVCKRHLAPIAGMTDDMAYLWSLRLLLERLSWVARDNDCDLDYTLAHVRRFKKAKLRQYEGILRQLPDCQVAWTHVPRGGSLSTPQADDRLQWADIAASATFKAFEPIRGYVEPRYLEHLGPALYRRRGNLLSYGLKVVPRPTPTGAYGWATRF